MRKSLLLMGVLSVFVATAEADACGWCRHRGCRTYYPPPCYYTPTYPRYYQPRYQQAPMQAPGKEAYGPGPGPAQAPAPGSAVPNGGPSIPGGVYDSGNGSAPR